MASSVLTVQQLGLDAAPAPASTDPAVPKPAATAHESKDWVDYVLPFVAVAVLLIAWRIAVDNIADPGYSRSAPPAAPVEGLAIFAVFFVAASGLERLLEPFTTLWDRKDDAQGALKEAAAAVATYKAKLKTWEETTDSTAKAARRPRPTRLRRTSTRRWTTPRRSRPKLRRSVDERRSSSGRWRACWASSRAPR